MMLNDQKRNAFAMLAIAICTNAIQGEQWISPQPRVFASPEGRFALKVVPDQKQPFKKPATATYFSLDEKGNEVIRWTRKLVNVPHQVLISDYAYIATINSWAGLGREHSLVLYGWRDGKAVVDYPLEKLLTLDEIAKHVKPGSYSRYWTHKASFNWKHVGSTSFFEVQFEWGKQIVFELTYRKDKSVEVKLKVSYAKNR